MVTLEEISSDLLQKPSSDVPPGLSRTQSGYKSLNTFELEKTRQYQQQFGDMYYLRLTKIKKDLDKVAEEAFGDMVIGGEPAKKVERVLDVRQGELCWVCGTVYMDMPDKPNILDDVSKDRWISAPSSAKKYYSEDGRDSTMLEDDSGRIRLVGTRLQSVLLVTGCIIAVMGTENANGDFEVIDVKFPDLAPQHERWHLTKPPPAIKQESKVKQEDVEMSDGSTSAASSGRKIAIVSSLNFSGHDTSHSMELALLLEYLLGEALDPTAQSELAHISRLIIAGNSLAIPRVIEETAASRASKKYGYDSSSYNALPSQLFDNFLSELLPTMPVTLLPGEQDPANTSMPQQPIHTAVFPAARFYSAMPDAKEAGWFDPVTNPWEGEVEGWRFLGTGGQNLDDVAKYMDSDDRLSMMEALCRWRCSAPTAPDTLWSYPFQDDEPFTMQTCPHLFFIGGQPEFSTKIIEGPEGQHCRLITVPKFATSKEVVLVDSETLDVTRVKIDVM